MLKGLRIATRHFSGRSSAPLCVSHFLAVKSQMINQRHSHWEETLKSFAYGIKKHCLCFIFWMNAIGPMTLKCVDRNYQHANHEAIVNFIHIPRIPAQSVWPGTFPNFLSESSDFFIIHNTLVKQLCCIEGTGGLPAVALCGPGDLSN